jgi:squalene synthase HpnC
MASLGGLTKTESLVMPSQIQALSRRTEIALVIMRLVRLPKGEGRAGAGGFLDRENPLHHGAGAMKVEMEASEEWRAAEAVEAPSGKGAADENFPVGSFLLPKRLRPHVATYYAFARAIDDIADDEAMSPTEKIRRLKAFDAALRGEPGYGPEFAKAHALRESMKSTGVSTVHGSDLVAAFVQDCEKLRYHSWEEVLGYCEKSANPVGRYLLDLHGEEKSDYRYSDALCTVLQIVNHLQDCADDKRSLDRVYIIDKWLVEEGGAVADIDGAAASPALRRVIDRMLDGCDALMVDARRLPYALKSRHLAMESAVIVNLAARLIALLRKGDPVATRVALKKPDFVFAGITGAVSGFFAPSSRGRIHRDAPPRGAPQDGVYLNSSHRHPEEPRKARRLEG